MTTAHGSEEPALKTSLHEPRLIASRTMGEYGFLWVLLAIINANIAASNRRSPVAWFLLSLVVGPLATVILLLRLAPPVAPDQGGSSSDPASSGSSA